MDVEHGQHRCRLRMGKRNFITQPDFHARALCLYPVVLGARPTDSKPATTKTTNPAAN
jgi:hypothetical protein